MGMGGVQRATYLASHLSQLGWNVTVFAADPKEYDAHDTTLLRKLPDSVDIVRYPASEASALKRRLRSKRRTSGSAAAAGSGISGWAMLPDSKVLSIPKMIGGMPALVERCHPDAVLTTSPPPSVHLIGLYLKRKYGIKWIADYRDVWFPQSRIAYKTPIHKSVHHRLERSFVQHADRTVVVSDGHLKLLKSKYEAEAGRTHHIPNGFDESVFAESQADRGRRDGFRIGYCGTLNHLTYVPGMFEAFMGAAQSNPVTFDICGVVTQDVSAEIDRVDPERRVINLLGYRDHDAAVRFRMECDVNLVTLAPEMSLESTIPGKTYETLRATRPLVALVPHDSSAWNLMSQFADVTLVDANHVDCLTNAVIELAGRPRVEIEKRAGIDEYSWDSLSGRYDRLIREVLT